MSQFDDFVDAVKGGLAPLIGDFADQAKAQLSGGVGDYLRARKADIERWTGDVREGRLSRLEFEDLVVTTASDVEIRLLAVAGIQTARLQRLRDAVINLVVEKALGTFVPG